MIDIILAAGYATRMYPLTENFPKPLLEVGGVTLLDRLLADLDAIEAIERHVIVSNHKFIACFEAWLQTARYTKPVCLIDDGSVDNDHRIGAVNDLLLALRTLEEQGIEPGDVMVLAADNVLDFSFEGYVRAFRERRTSMIMCYEEPSLQVLQRCGVVCLDDDGRVVLMEEKPREPKSHWVVPPFYIYAREDLPLVKTSVSRGCGYDAPGNLVHWLCTQRPIHAFPMPGRRFDIGNLETYEKMKNERVPLAGRGVL